MLGYHGCARKVAEELLAGGSFRSSQNDYDWLGSGIYFWEANPQRGFDFATEALERQKVAEEPAVVGAVIDLGLCLDLTTLAGIRYVEAAYNDLAATFKSAEKSLPRNSSDLLRRRLDCAVINWLHTLLKAEGVKIDTVRGLFIEGSPIYPSAGFHAKTHSQIAVCNPNCIKGIFRVPSAQLRWPAAEIA